MTSKTSSDPDSQISLLLGRAYYSYLGMLGRLLKARKLDKQLRPGIGTILFALYRDDDLTATEIGTRLGLARSTMARLVEKVRKLGLVVGRADPNDGRALRLSLTKEARDLMPQCFELANHIESTICRGFTPAERETFSALLLRATANITKELDTLDTSKASSKR
ncbi:MAG: MarR family winged helix-turn-helix transcriptional regulator [Verrucomicrobiales bacterium]|jgi:DNA-binding MarR family transcriptional regulator|nr:MarR family winged helix-turn-helix transcriptional regulator [Verrucomicrobiales bacterium]MDP4793075.1 MarR family winged helix-turn-helix transcriptional regulator [Verrucomicrobiales bacterium]MDP4939726.1 MarR family winged helix-turn-helix transcriptional regulator [Verrucomicrobiales bacterium]